MNKKRPLGITILAILIGLGALVAVYHTLQFLHLLPFSLGPVRFFAFDILGAFLWGVNAMILIWVVSSLWNLRMEGRLFVLVIAVLNLILAFFSILGQSSFSAMLPAILINLIVLIYCLTPGVASAFEPVSKPAAMVGRSPAAEAPAPVVPRSSEPAAEVPPGMMDEQMAPISEQALSAPPLTIETPPPPPDEAPIEAAAAAISVPPVADQVAEELPPAPVKRAAVPVETIEGIGPVYAAKLKAVGIDYVSDLLQAGASRKGREDLVEKTAISSVLVLKWVNMADLMRISGIGEEYSELLEAAGVDTVKELRNRNPENLYQAMLEANQQRSMVRRVPHLSEVQSWVEQAKQLEPVMTY